jgi:hypothetical protein
MALEPENAPNAEGASFAAAWEDIGGVKYAVNILALADGTQIGSGSPFPVFGPLTDAQLRTAPVTVEIEGTQNVSGTVEAEFTIAPIAYTFTHGTTTANVVATPAAANPDRKTLSFQNLSDTDMWVRWDGSDPVIGTQGFLLAPGKAISFPVHEAPAGPFKVLCGASAKAWALAVA